MATPNAAAMKKLQAQGKAIRNAKGDPSFQIQNGTDLDHAIKAIGRVRPNTDAARAKVRKYVMQRAAQLGLKSKIPDTWDSSGNLKDDMDDSPSDTGPDTDDVKAKSGTKAGKAARIFKGKAA